MDNFSMLYSNDVDDWFTSDFAPSPSGFFSDQEMAFTLDGVDLSIIDDLMGDTNPANAFAAIPTTPQPEDMQGLDLAQSQLFDGNFLDLLAALPGNNSSQNDPPQAEGTSNQSSVIKSSSTINTADFINNSGYYYTEEMLQLTIPPLGYQRVRYAAESDKVLRYIFVPNNAVTTLTVSNLLCNIAPRMSPFLRITRLTKPYGTDRLVFYHPYPVWLNDQNGRVYNNSVFLPVAGRTIQIEKLVLPRLKQRMLQNIQAFPIFSADQLDFNSFHSVNTERLSAVVQQYELRYSILHFQICFVTENNMIYRTNLQCQTEPIYQYEGGELDELPPYVRQVQKKSEKRKAIGQLKKSSKKTKIPQKKACG